MTFRFAADADCAVVDRQDFPGRLSAPCPGADVICDFHGVRCSEATGHGICHAEKEGFASLWSEGTR